MAIKAKWTNRDDAPEWARNDLREVKDKDGKVQFYTLDVEGQRPKEDVDVMRDRNTTLTQQLEELQAKLDGALTAEEASQLQGEIQTLRDANATVDEKRIAAELDKTLVTVKIGDKEVRVHKSNKAALEAQIKTLGETATQTAEVANKRLGELRKERVTNASLVAMQKIGGFKQKAHDDVIRHVESVFVLGDDLQAYIPDLDADPEGKTPKAGKDGKPLTPETYLRQVVESGEKTGVWIDEPRGTSRQVRPPASTGATGERRQTSSDLIRSGIEKRRTGQGA